MEPDPCSTDPADLTAVILPALRFVRVPSFDARRGLRRCVPGGAGVFLGRSHAEVDFWRNLDGELLLRFSSYGYRYSYKAMLVHGGAVPDEMLDLLSEEISEVLLQWLVDGPDEAPELPELDEEQAHSPCQPSE